MATHGIVDAAEHECPEPTRIPLRLSRLGWADPIWSKVSMGLLALVSITYFYSTIRISVRNPLWMDEVMASWMAKLPFKTIPVAILKGTISSPPTYFYLLKLTRLAFGGSHLALRMPSVLAVFVAGTCVFLLMRRRFSAPIAAVAMALSLETALLSYATQIREYVLLTALFALAALLWSDERNEISTPRLALITLLLAGCVALHFYGVLLVGTFGFMEILRSLATRRVRLALWGGIALAAGSVLVWYPMVRKISRITGGYASSSHYYARPTVSRLLTAYGDLAFGGKGESLFCATLLALAVILFWQTLRRRARARNIVESVPFPPQIEIVILGSLLVPVFVFMFALFVTGTFNERYALTAALGFSMLIGRLISGFSAGPVLSCGMLLLSVPLLAMAPTHVYADHYGMQVLSSLPGTDPIVVGEGLAFLELKAAAGPAVEKRLVYLTTPPGEPNPDPTNEDLVKRWTQFRSDLNVQDARQFLASHAHFYLIHTDQSTDVITPWLMRNGCLRARWNNGMHKDTPGVWIFEAIPQEVTRIAED
jgi:Dolichyl-phosphate-mannose-protein mannosyltransferase